jgi:hypothetical protein
MRPPDKQFCKNEQGEPYFHLLEHFRSPRWHVGLDDIENGGDAPQHSRPCTKKTCLVCGIGGEVVRCPGYSPDTNRPEAAIDVDCGRQKSEEGLQLSYAESMPKLQKADPLRQAPLRQMRAGSTRESRESRQVPSRQDLAAFEQIASSGFFRVWDVRNGL